MGFTVKSAKPSSTHSLPNLAKSQIQLTLEAALSSHEKGWKAIPVDFKSKACTMKGWPTLSLSSEQIKTSFATPSNLGILLEGSNLTDIDIDHPNALLFTNWLPPTGAIWGRPSAPASHYLYQGVLKSHSFKLADKPIIEIRSTGCYATIPPSHHPEKEVYAWQSEGIPGLAGDHLYQCAAKIAIAVTLLRHWKPGSRHTLALAISAILLKANWDAAQVMDFVKTVAKAAGDPEIEDRIKAVKTTEQTIANGKSVAGASKLSDLIGLLTTTHIVSWAGSKATLPSKSDKESFQTHPQQDAHGSSGLNLICAKDIEAEQIAWLWYGWLAKNKFHLLGGIPGSGKTTTALDMAASITSGKQWPDGSLPTETGSVIIWSGEDGIADVLKPRLQVAGADLNKVHFIGGVSKNGEQSSFDPSKDIALLEKEIAKLGDVKLLIIDPIAYGVAGDSNKNGDVRKGLQPIVELAASTGIAVLGITHLTKGTSGNLAQERITGSVAYAALARVIMVAAAYQEPNLQATHLLCRVKSNIGPNNGGIEYSILQESLKTNSSIIASNIKWGNFLEGNSQVLIAKAEYQAPEKDSELSDAIKFLTDLLKDGSLPATEIEESYEAAGYTKATIRRAQKDLGIKAIKTQATGKQPSFWQWSLPPQKLDNSQDVIPKS